MKTFTKKSEIQEFIALNGHKHSSIGFVPTMGALHKGHLSLITAAKADNSLVICSIFVNPTQFNNLNDLEKYPRTLEKDAILLEEAGCDVLFCPSTEEMYDSKDDFSYQPAALSLSLEGEFRPGHFKGVAQIVYKLFDLIKPNKAYFGLKDYQQLLVITEMVKDLNLPVDIIPCPILREANGLAMSSRNERLSAQDRESAKVIYESLLIIQKEASSISSTQTLIEKGLQHLNTIEGMELEYLRIVDANTLIDQKTLNKNQQAIALIAVNYGGVRLIDNQFINS